MFTRTHLPKVFHILMFRSFLTIKNNEYKGARKSINPIRQSTDMNDTLTTDLSIVDPLTGLPALESTPELSALETDSPVDSLADPLADPLVDTPDSSVETTISESSFIAATTAPTSPATTLLPGSSAPLFSSFFAGANFFPNVAAGGGVFVAGVEDATNIFVFGDAAGENDVAVGGNEVDILMVNAGDDNIMGAAGTDFVFGGLGDDIVRGGTGDDVVVGNEGSDVLISGEGSDIYEFFADQFVEGDQDTILDFEEGRDAIVIVGSTDAAYNPLTGLLSVDGAEVASLETGLNIDVLARNNSAVLFSSEADLSGFGTALSESAEAESAEAESTSESASESETTPSESLIDATAVETAVGSLEAGSTPPLFSSFFAGASFFDEPQSGGGVFVAGQEAATNFILFDKMAASNDVAVGGNEVDIIMGEAGEDNIMGAGGTDFMFGGVDDDIVRGGRGDDVIVGNEGSDVLISGSGSDIFEFFSDQFIAGELDVVLDFELGQDAIVVVGSTDTTYDALSGFLAVDGNNVAVLEAGLDLTTTIREGSSVLA